MTRIKICGITNLDDALMAIEAGADALGFISYSESKRYINKKDTATIIDQLPPFITTVGVFVNADQETIESTANHCHLDVIQLHGRMPPNLLHTLNRRFIRVFRIKDESSIVSLPNFPVTTYHLDAFVQGKWGGTGQVFDWKLARQAKNRIQKEKQHARIILAGGLDPDNVADAVRDVRPYAVDVASGVEASPRRKDPAKVKAFIRAVREADREWEQSN